MSFPQFRLLPLELQLKIWCYAILPTNRVVDIFAVSISESLQPRLKPSTDLNETKPETWIRTFVERIYTTPQPLSCLHICPQARSLAFKRYSRINADMEFQGDMNFNSLSLIVQPDGCETVFSLGTLKGHRPFALLDPKCDILFLQDPPQLKDGTGGLIISSMEVLVRWLSKDITETLRSLALPYSTWRKTRDAGSLKVLMEFRGLEALFVSFLSGSPSGKYRATWSDMVGELWSHIEEVQDEVRGDVENLRRKYPEWRQPIVKVVKHRGILMKRV